MPGNVGFEPLKSDQRLGCTVRFDSAMSEKTAHGRNRFGNVYLFECPARRSPKVHCLGVHDSTAKTTLERLLPSNTHVGLIVPEYFWKKCEHHVSH